MCISYKPKNVAVYVKPNENYTVWQNIRAKSRNHVNQFLPRFRYECSLWLASLGGPIPAPINQLLLHSCKNDFFPEPTRLLQFHLFASVLYFFASNSAPFFLRRQFWSVYLDRPVFDSDGLVGNGHPYVAFCLGISSVNTETIFKLGGFYNVSTKNPFHEGNVTKFEAFNVWAVRGIYREGLGGTKRVVDTRIRIVDVHFLAIDWIATGILSPEILSPFFHPGINNGGVGVNGE